MNGILLLTRCISSRVSGTSAVPAIARKCSTPFVEPLFAVSRDCYLSLGYTNPSAIVNTKAFSKDSLVRRSRGRIFFSMQILMASAAFVHSLIFAGDSAGFEEDPGRHNPMASMAVDMVFAVYIPPQAPAPGHACCSKSSYKVLLVTHGS
jgi:hypothetical protein